MPVKASTALDDGIRKKSRVADRSGQMRRADTKEYI